MTTELFGNEYDAENKDDDMLTLRVQSREQILHGLRNDLAEGETKMGIKESTVDGEVLLDPYADEQLKDTICEYQVVDGEVEVTRVYGGKIVTLPDGREARLTLAY